MREQIGLIGIGLVGTALAENLLKAGYGVVGFDIVPEKCRLLEQMGGQAGAGPADVAAQCRRVILSLMTSQIVRQVLEGEDGILSAKLLPQLIIDTTTADPQATPAIAALCRQRGLAYLDATISGSSAAIRRQEGVFMVGGEAEDFQACLDLLKALAQEAFYLGPSGAGAKAKLAVNLVLGLNRLALAEALVFAEGLGLELAGFLELLKSTPAYSRIMDSKGLKMLSGDFTAEGRLAQHAKDVQIILAQAALLGIELPLSRRHLEVLKAAIAAGDGELDNAAVIREIRRRRQRQG
jgi:3-hydroxyisobutyrate dehydrogenase-like beta-hydroxyacid dehydrogenase